MSKHLTYRRTLLVFVLLVQSVLTFGQSDTELTMLVDFEVDPKSVDVTDDATIVASTMTTTDPPVGRLCYTPLLPQDALGIW